jgi:hypothetical protein
MAAEPELDVGALVHERQDAGLDARPVLVVRRRSAEVADA